MSAKNLFRALIASPFVSERSAPDWDNQVDLASAITNGTAGKEITYTPAADGYVSFAVFNNTDAVSYARLSSGGTESALNVPAQAGFSTALRVRKGVAMSMLFQPNLPQVYWARFVRTVGGVKRLLSQAFSRAEVVYG